MKKSHPGWDLMYLFTPWRLLETILFFVAPCLKSIKISLVMMIAITETTDINAFMPNVFSHPYQLDEPISNFWVVGWYFSFLLKF